MMIDMHAHWRPAEVTDALRARTKEPRIVRNQDGVDVVKSRMGEETSLVFLADPGESVVDEPAQRDGYVERLALDPAERAEQRQHAGAHALAVHPREVEGNVIKRLGQRLLAVA